MNEVTDKLTPESRIPADASNLAVPKISLPEPFFGPAITCNRARSLAIIFVPLVVVTIVLRGPEATFVVRLSLSNMRGEATAMVATKMTENRLENVMLGNCEIRNKAQSENVVETVWVNEEK